MLEKLKKTYTLFNKIENSNAMESLSFILDEEDINLKSKLLKKAFGRKSYQMLLFVTNRYRVWCCKY